MIKVNRKNLSTALGFVGKATQSRTTLPILQCVKLAYDDELTLMATNLSTTLIRKMSDSIADSMDDEHFVTCVPFLEFKSIVDVDSANEVILSLNGDTLTVTIGKVKSKIKCLSAEEFPLIDLSDAKTVCYIDAETLKKCVERVAYAATADTNQEKLHSVYFDAESSLSLVSLDQFGKMSVVDTGVVAQEPFNVIMPLKTSEFIPFLEGKVDIGLSQGKIAFQSPSSTVISQIVDGKYPAYRTLIPTTFNGIIHGEPKSLLDALKAVQVFSKDDSDACVISVKDGSLLVGSRRTTEKGDSDSSVDADVDLGGDFKFTCNAVLLSEAIKHSANRYQIKFTPLRNGAIITSDPYDGWTAAVAFMNTKNQEAK